MSEMNHLTEDGAVRMVDVGSKPKTVRVAEATGRLRLSAAARNAITSGALKKGDPLQVARIAGIQAAKRTAELIPLCHQVPLSHVDIDANLDDEGITVIATVRPLTPPHRWPAALAGRSSVELGSARGRARSTGRRRCRCRSPRSR